MFKKVSGTIISIIIGIVIFVGLFLAGVSNSLAVIGILRLVSVFLAVSVFVVTWNARQYIRNSAYLVLGGSFLFVGIFELLSFLTQENTSIMPMGDLNMSNQLWLVSRLFGSLCFLITPLFTRVKVKPFLIVLIYFIICLFPALSIFTWKTFPVCYIPGAGMTQFMRNAGIVASLVYFASVFTFMSRWNDFDKTVRRLLIAFPIMRILSSIILTTSGAMLSASYLVGLYLSVVAFYLVYIALVQIGLERPYETLFEDLRETTEEARQQQERLKLIFNQFPATLFTLDKNLIFTAVTGAGLHPDVQAKPELLVGQNARDVFINDPSSLEAYERALTGERVRHETNWMDCTWEGVVEPLRDDTGKIDGIIGVTLEVTEQRKAEKELRKKQEELELINEQLPAAIAALDKDLRIQIVYGNVSKPLEHMKRTAVGKTVYQFFNTEDPDFDPIRVYREALRGVSGSFETSVERLDFSVQVVPRRDINGNITGVIAVVTETTKLRQTERELRESKTKLDLVLSQIPGIIWTTDNSLCYTEYYGTRLTTAYNKRLMELKGKSIDEVYSEEREPEGPVIREAHHAALNGESRRYERTWPDGTVFDAFVQPLRDEKGKIAGVIGIAIDVTQRKKLETELIAKNKELDNFAFRVSHDLKVPLVIMGGYISVMKDEPEKCRDYADMLLSQAESVTNLVDSLLKLARAGLVIEKKQEVDLNLTVISALAQLEGRKKNAELRMEKPLPIINGDPDRLMTLFTNIFENSIQYRDPAKEKVIIEIDYTQKENTLLLCIRDNGIGIEAARLEKIFEYGYSSNPYKKSGLGLTTSKKIVEAHGGRIWAESAGQARGAEFFISLPK